jgi:molybdenum cofactor cytidylyltransferase
VALTDVGNAAGASRRLGSPKQLLEFVGETLLHRAARIATEAGPTVVVLRDRTMEHAIADLDVTVIENPDADEGMASSIRRAVETTAGDLLLMVCDQPHVTAAHLRALATADGEIAATGYSGIAGVPARFGAKFRDELFALRGDVGARRVIENHREVVVTIPFEAASIDVDNGPAVSL